MKSSNVRAAWVPRVVSLAVVAVILLRVAEARSDARCVVRLLPSDPASAWVLAARNLDRHLQTLHDGGGCSAIEIRVESTRAQLIFTTQGGRQAVRELTDPQEIGATVQALQITLDPNPVWAPLPPPAPTPPDSHLEVAAEAPPPAPQPGPSGIVGGSLGARTGGGLVAPVVTAFGALHGGHWEFGVLAQWEIAYQPWRGQEDPEWSATALGAGLLLGGRQALSSSLTAVAGGNIVGVMVHEETHHVHPQQESTRAASRLGAYVGVVWPQRSSIRLRAQLAGDFEPVASSQTGIVANVPPLPVWGATLSLGVECGEAR